MHPYIVISASLLIGYFTSKYAKKLCRRPHVWFSLGFFFGIFAPIILTLLPKIDPEPEPVKPPPPIPTFLPREWYYLDDEHTQIGPVSFRAMGDAYKNGHLKESNYIWNEEMEGWEHLSTQTNILESFKEFS